MWKTEGDNVKQGGNAAESAVRQGVLRGKRRLAAYAIGAMLCVAALVAVYFAWQCAFRGNAPTAGDGSARGDTRPPVADGDAARGDSRPPKVKESVAMNCDPPKARGDTRPPMAGDGGAATNGAKRLYRGVEVVSSSCSTNLDGAVVERLNLADGSFVKAVRLPEPAFRRPTDQIIAMAVSAEPGAAVPPLPIGPDAERGFLDSLSEPILDLDSDTPKVRRLKAMVREARAQIAEAMRGGSSFREAMEAHVRECARIADARAEAVRMAQEVRREGGEAEARAFTERANAVLEADGVPPIPVPGKERLNN